GAADTFRRADHLYVAGCEQFQNALVEAEVANRILNLSVLDQPDTVARQSGEQLRSRINAADVPEPAHQQTAFGRLDHVFDADSFRGAFHNGVHPYGRWLFDFFLRPVG